MDRKSSESLPTPSSLSTNERRRKAFRWRLTPTTGRPVSRHSCACVRSVSSRGFWISSGTCFTGELTCRSSMPPYRVSEKRKPTGKDIIVSSAILCVRRHSMHHAGRSVRQCKQGQSYPVEDAQFARLQCADWASLYYEKLMFP